jgi:hypothetical protein
MAGARSWAATCLQDLSNSIFAKKLILGVNNTLQTSLIEIFSTLVLTEHLYFSISEFRDVRENVLTGYFVGDKHVQDIDRCILHHRFGNDGPNPYWSDIRKRWTTFTSGARARYT